MRLRDALTAAARVRVEAVPPCPSCALGCSNARKQRANGGFLRRKQAARRRTCVRACVQANMQANMRACACQPCAHACNTNTHTPGNLTVFGWAPPRPLSTTFRRCLDGMLAHGCSAHAQPHPGSFYMTNSAFMPAGTSSISSILSSRTCSHPFETPDPRHALAAVSTTTSRSESRGRRVEQE